MAKSIQDKAIEVVKKDIFRRNKRLTDGDIKDVSRKGLGYDLHVPKRNLYVEVKGRGKEYPPYLQLQYSCYEKIKEIVKDKRKRYEMYLVLNMKKPKSKWKLVRVPSKEVMQNIEFNVSCKARFSRDEIRRMTVN